MFHMNFNYIIISRDNSFTDNGYKVTRGIYIYISKKQTTTTKGLPCQKE